MRLKESEVCKQNVSKIGWTEIGSYWQKQVMIYFYWEATSVTDGKQRNCYFYILSVGVNDTVNIVRKFYEFEGKQILHQDTE